MTSLWEAVGAQIGRPPLWRPLPCRRSPVWEQFCNAVESFIGSPGLLHRRGPSWVYRQLHSQIPPSRLTWGDLLGDMQFFNAAALSLLLASRPNPTLITVLSWNIRWIVDPHSEASAAKRSLLSRLLAKGYVICIQETHWSAADAAVWQHGLLLRNLYWTPAVDMADPCNDQNVAPSPNPSRCGGVATLLPAGFSFAPEGCTTLVPGFAISTTIRNPRHEHLHLVNLYLRPGNQEDIWQRAMAALPADAHTDPARLVVGDFNTDLAVAVPRPNSLLREMCSTWGILKAQKPTWRGRGEMREIDGGLVSISSLPDWDVTTQWTPFSDHAILTFRRGARPVPKKLACSPARFWALPEEARVELRRNWGYIAGALRVPESNDPTPHIDQSRPQRPEETARDDPTCETGEPTHATVQSPPGPRPANAGEPPEEPTFLPLFARWGHRFTTAAFSTWWRKWRAVHNPKDQERTELSRIASSQALGAQPVSPSLAAWLNTMGGPETLTPSEARVWLGVRVCLEEAASAATRHVNNPNARLDQALPGKRLLEEQSTKRRSRTTTSFRKQESS